MPGLDVIRIRNAAFYAYHGAGENEQELGGKFEFDVDMYCNLYDAAETDSLGKTLDYEKVYAFIQRVALEKRYYLLEALAQAVAKQLLQEFVAIAEVTVRVRKPHPPVKGVVDFVEVEIRRKR